jgi:isocitrate dehydrogenase
VELRQQTTRHDRIDSDRSYSGVYEATIEFCKRMALLTHNNGKCSKRRFDGTKAEEYGSHDKTFQMTADGVVRVTDTEGNVLMEQPVEEKDIFRMCQVKDAPIQDWVKLVNRARATNVPTIFWLTKTEHMTEK